MVRADAQEHPDNVSHFNQKERKVVSNAVKIKALAKALKVTKAEAEKLFEDGNYTVFTVEEADEFAATMVFDNLGNVGSTLVAKLTGRKEAEIEALKDSMSEHEAAKALEKIIKKTVGVDKFLTEAVKAIGRGHLIASYDSEEIEVDGLLIYRNA